MKGVWSCKFTNENNLTALDTLRPARTMQGADVDAARVRALAIAEPMLQNAACPHAPHLRT